jgi:CRISPR/Cas system-associated endonuclease Cas1
MSELRNWFKRTTRRQMVKQIVKEKIYLTLLETLPKSYKEEAKNCFWEEKDRQSISEAFQYFLGGIEYRIRKIFFALSDLFLSIDK